MTQNSCFFVSREPNTNPLGTPSRRIGWRDPGHLASHRIALIVFRQAEEEVNIVPQSVITRGGHKQSTICEGWNVRCIKRTLLPKHQLYHTGAARCTTTRCSTRTCHGRELAYRAGREG